MKHISHTFRLPPPSGPFAIATCECGATTTRRNAWEGDYTSEELAKAAQNGREKTAKRTPRVSLGKAALLPH